MLNFMIIRNIITCSYEQTLRLCIQRRVSNFVRFLRCPSISLLQFSIVKHWTFAGFPELETHLAMCFDCPETRMCFDNLRHNTVLYLRPAVWSSVQYIRNDHLHFTLFLGTSRLFSLQRILRYELLVMK